ncbi:glycosyltransferase family 4 protein [Streptomyces albidoflavus]
MRIAFLIYNAYGIGGTIRSTLNLASALAASGRHEVSVVSVHRPSDLTQLPTHPAVQLRALLDWRETSPTWDGGHRRAGEPTEMFEDQGVTFGTMAPSALTDDKVREFLRTTDAEAVIATRPILNGYLARYGDQRYLRIGQEHLTFDMHTDQLREDQNQALVRLDAFVTVSEGDAARYRTALPGISTRILCIPNGVPTTDVEPSRGDSRTIVAAGRLVEIKRYDRLLDAFAKLAPRFPDWQLRIYGRGKQKQALTRRLEELGLHNQVRLMGAVSPIEPEWAKGAIAAVSSDGESFGMTIVEAMHCGVPVVATDCPHGPGEIIEHGKDGLLVPLDASTAGYADALATLMEDEDLRAELADNARTKATQYAPERMADRYLELFRQLRPAAKGARITRFTALFRRAEPATRPPAAETTPWQPRARVRISGEGDLYLTLDLHGAPAGHHNFVLRKRGTKGQTALTLPTDREGRATVLRDVQTLGEGRWDVCVRGPGGEVRRVAAGLVESAALVPLPPLSSRGHITSWIPYTTDKGNLSIRTWQRGTHAEVARLDLVQDSLSLSGQLQGAVPTQPGAILTATPREAVAGAVLEYPASLSPDGVWRATLSPQHLLNAHHASGEEQTIWDLGLRLAPGQTATLARIGSDSSDRKTTDLLPAVECCFPDSTVRLRPYYTVDNNLALSTRTLPTASTADGSADRAAAS